MTGWKPPACCTYQDRGILDAAWLKTLSLADMVRHATPFFWFNVVRCHVGFGNAGSEPAVASALSPHDGLRRLLLLAPDGFSCRLPAGDNPGVVLPRLGLRCQPPAGRSDCAA